MKVIDLNGDVGFEITAANLKSQLPKDGKEDVILDVYSFGGSIFEGMALYNVIKDYKGNVTARIGSIGASASSFFPLAADKVVARSNSTMMIHKGWMFAVGNADEMAKASEILSGLDGLIAGIYAKKTKKDKAVILEDMKNETWLMGWEDIVNYGLADELEESDEEVIEKSEAVAKIEAIKAKIKESGMFKSDLEKAAAWLPKVKVNNSVVDGIKNIKEETMTFNELVESDPKAKEELEKIKASSFSAGYEDAKSKEHERVSEILDLAGIGLSDQTMDAVKTGMDAGQFAKLVIKNGHKEAAKPNANVLKGINSAKEIKDDISEDGFPDDGPVESVLAMLKKNKNKRR